MKRGKFKMSSNSKAASITGSGFCNFIFVDELLFYHLKLTNDKTFIR
jgi:hypothetical protein